MAVANGQLANQTTFNTAFVSRTVDTSTVGRLALNNTLSESGTSITSAQKELNSLNSFTGKTINTAKDVLPSWTNNDIGASGNNLFQRTNLLTAEFNPSTGHTHSGAAGEGPKIDLATSVDDFLPVANGGLNNGTFNQQAIIYLNGTHFSSASGYFAASATHFGLYTDTPSAGFDLNSTMGIRQTANTATGNITALSYPTSLVRFTNSPSIFGIDSTGTENSFLYLMNSSSGSIIVANDSASASIANRIITGTSTDYTLASGQIALLIYDKTSSRWRLSDNESEVDHTHSGAAGQGPKISLTGSVSGLLPVANAGLGNATFNTKAIIYYNGSTFVSASGYFDTAATHFGLYTDAPSASFDLNGTIGIRQTNSTATGNVAALSPTTSLMRFSNSPTIQGVDATGVENTFVYMMNASSGTITIANDSGSATSTNRIITGTDADFSLASGGMCLVAYDKTSTRWRLMGGGGSTSNSGGGALVVTGSRASPQNITASGGIAFTGSSARQLWFVKGNSGLVDVTANPQIASGVTIGQELILIGRSNTDTLLLEDGTGLSLNGSYELGDDSSLYLIWDGTNWVETTRRE